MLNRPVDNVFRDPRPVLAPAVKPAWNFYVHRHFGKMDGFVRRRPIYGR